MKFESGFTSRRELEVESSPHARDTHAMLNVQLYRYSERLRFGNRPVSSARKSLDGYVLIFVFIFTVIFSAVLNTP